MAGIDLNTPVNPADDDTTVNDWLGTARTNAALATQIVDNLRDSTLPLSGTRLSSAMRALEDAERELSTIRTLVMQRAQHERTRLIADDWTNVRL